ncbi:response regulator transcription factor [Planktomarina sp.]|nr:response regulator transcription factor [Planktomarina sp.]
MTTLKKILLIESDPDLREALCEQLHCTDQFEVFSSGNDTETLQKLRVQSYDMIVMDLHPLNNDSLEACRVTYAQNVKCPILLLTERDEISSTVFGQDARASDYIIKPFKFPILLARMNIQLRMYEKSYDSAFTLGPYTFHPAMKILKTHDNNEIQLTEKETDILKFLYHTVEDVVPRDILLHEVWGYNNSVTTHTLETHIYRLRQKIERNPGAAELLVTETGGYRLKV